MLGEKLALEELAQLELAFRDQINGRTWNGVDNLKIEVVPDLVSVTGTVTSFYLKQLALEAIKEVVSVGAVPPVRMDIRVRLNAGYSVAVHHYV